MPSEKIHNPQTNFFCESCHQGVSLTTSVCPHCGAYFAGVKCPRCHYSGVVEEFIKGCPQCGFIHGNVRSSTLGATKRKRVRQFFDLPVPVFISILATLLVSIVLLGLWYQSLL